MGSWRPERIRVVLLPWQHCSFCGPGAGSWQVVWGLKGEDSYFGGGFLNYLPLSFSHIFSKIAERPSGTTCLVRRRREELKSKGPASVLNKRGPDVKVNSPFHSESHLCPDRNQAMTSWLLCYELHGTGSRDVNFLFIIPNGRKSPANTEGKVRL